MLFSLSLSIDVSRANTSVQNWQVYNEPSGNFGPKSLYLLFSQILSSSFPQFSPTPPLASPPLPSFPACPSPLPLLPSVSSFRILASFLVFAPLKVRLLVSFCPTIRCFRFVVSFLHKQEIFEETHSWSISFDDGFIVWRVIAVLKWPGQPPFPSSALLMLPTTPAEQEGPHLSLRRRRFIIDYAVDPMTQMSIFDTPGQRFENIHGWPVIFIIYNI